MKNTDKRRQLQGVFNLCCNICYPVGRQNGWLSSNDIREMENMNPIPDEEGGNLYLINGNLTKLKDAGLFGKQNGGKDETKE